MILQGKVSLISADGITQLHIFIFVLAAFHVLSCIITLTLNRAKVFKVKSLFLLRLLFGARIQLFRYCSWFADEEMEEMGNRDGNI